MRSRRRFVALALGLATAVAALSVATTGSASNALEARSKAAPPKLSPQTPDLLIITIDTLRPDALGWVAGKNDTPNLDSFAREGFRFPAAVSPVPLTLPAHTSIFSGLVPRRHGVRDNGWTVPGSARLLAVELQKRGYATGAFVSGYPLRSPFGLDRGFDRYDDRLPVGQEGWLERKAPDTIAAALAWRRSLPTGKPCFLWIHLYDAHDPYEPPREFWRPGPRGSYDGEVAFLDDALGKLRQDLGARGRPLATVIAADHGEAFGEHGEHGHGFFIYDSTMLVPLVFHFPGRIAPGASRLPARLVDIAPTVLDLLGLPTWTGVDGVTLRPLFSSQRGATPFVIPPAYVESRQPWITYGWAPLAAIRTASAKLIAAPRPELFDLAKDPSENENRVDHDRPKARELQKLLRAAESAPETTAVTVDDPAVLAQLRSLGYLGSGRVAGEPPAGLADPKDRLALRDRLSVAEGLVRQGKYREAIAEFEAVLAVDRDNRYASLRLGMATLKAGDAKAAIPRLTRAVALDPAQPEARYALADALSRAGQWQKAIPEWLETVRLEPRRSAAWSNLGMAFTRTGALARGVEAFERAAGLEPQNRALVENLATARFELARNEAAAGKIESAKKLLAQAVAVVPTLKDRAKADPTLARLLP